ncbi:SWI/SNF-related matrix-associated actin-dependent regulator of chromatin subfamily A3 [Mytilus galloprovincialis]|nr:SWI/SNF-related matrix-associated actin-dependent regulator of chromatin subfamily A3 [Mytilus galloprovincialis]
MEEIKCTEHKQLCYLKTGTKAGPNYGVSFYVCPLSCGFFKQTQISSTKCPQHPDEIVDLQAIFFGKSSGEKRRYHRCHGRIAGQSWCGHNSEKKASVKPLGDHNHQNLEKQSTSDSMPPAHQKQTKTPPKQDNSKESPSDSIKSQTDKARSHSNSKAKSHDTETADDDIVDGVVNLSIIDDSDEADQNSFEKLKKSAQKDKSNTSKEEGMNQAMANLSTYDEEEFEDNPSDKSYDLKSNSSGSLPSPGFTDKDGKKSPRTDIAEKYSKYKIKKKSSLSPSQQDKEISNANYHENNTKHQSPNSDVNLPLSERIRLKSNESIKSSLSSCSSTSEDVNSPGRKSEVIDLISDSDEDESEKEAGLPEQPKRYQPPSQQQTASQQNQKSGSESIIKDAVQQAQDQRSQMKSSLPQQVTQNIVQGQKPHTQFIAPKPSALTSADMYNLQLDIDRRTDLQRQLERLKHVVATAKMSALPDKGEKLIRQVEDVDRALKAVSRKIDNTMQTMRSNKTGQDTGSNNNPAATQGAVSTNNTQQPADSSQYQTYKIVQPDEENIVVRRYRGTSASTQPISTTPVTQSTGIKQTRKIPKVKSSLTDAQNSQHGWYGGEKQQPAGGNLVSKKLVKSRATLVICPASLIHQWKTEIERRVKGSRLKVMLYHGPDRESDILRLADNDVVLTTYNLVAKEVGAADINAEDPAKDEDPDEEDKKDELSAVKHKSDSKMLRIAWDRIVLDEAHNIKNHKSLTAVAVCRLRAGFRWALTGTPIQNKLLDIFSLLRFLRCSPFDEYKLWKKQVERDNSGHSRLNVLVKCLLLRRTKNQVDKAGKPLVSFTNLA